MWFLHIKELVSSDAMQTSLGSQLKQRWRRLCGHRVNTKSLKSYGKIGSENGIYIFLVSFMYSKSPKL